MTFRYRKLNIDGDMKFGQGRDDYYIDNPAAVAQSIKTRLGLWTGEWFLNINEGTNWMNVVGVVGAYNVRDTVIRARILQTPYVTSLYDWKSEIWNRKYTASGKVVTAFGTADIGISASPGFSPEVTWGGLGTIGL
jgi:hypothetical protein